MPFQFDAVRDVLRCPKSRSELVQDGESLVSVDPACRLRYSIRDGIPIMLVDDATELSPFEWGTIMERHGRDPQSGRSV